jgi:hypothetical protein
MMRRLLFVLGAAACLAASSLTAQEPLPTRAANAPSTARSPAAGGGGPRLEPAYPSYQPSIVQREEAAAMAAAADRTVITISTLGLVLLAILLIILLT